MLGDVGWHLDSMIARRCLLLTVSWSDGGPLPFTVGCKVGTSLLGHRPVFKIKLTFRQ